MSLFGINKPIYWQPESLGRLYWFKSERHGHLTLNVRDDAGSQRHLNGWGITVREDPPIIGPTARHKHLQHRL